MNGLISRQKAIYAVRGIIDDTPDNELSLEDVAFRDGVQSAISVLYNVPSAQPERKRGRWIRKNGHVGDVYYLCSACRESCVIFPKNYCPDCGADMRG